MSIKKIVKYTEDMLENDCIFLCKAKKDLKVDQQINIEKNKLFFILDFGLYDDFKDSVFIEIDERFFSKQSLKVKTIKTKIENFNDFDFYIISKIDKDSYLNLHDNYLEDIIRSIERAVNRNENSDNVEYISDNLNYLLNKVLLFQQEFFMDNIKKLSSLEDKVEKEVELSK